MDTAEPVNGAVHRTAAATAFSLGSSSTSPSSSFAVFASNEQNQLANNTSKATTSSPPSSATVVVASTEYKECANCGVNDTPLWRKYNDHDLCNACGIYFRVNGFHRPFLPNMRKLLSSARKMGLSCVNCSTKITSMWRRTPEGESICNACGLYYRLNGVKRPVSMRKDWIRKRQRKTQQISGIMRLANQTILSTSVVEQQQQQQQQQIVSVNSSGVSQQQQQQQQLPAIPLHESSSFDSNQQQQQQQQQQLNQLNQSQCFQLVNGVHDICSNELVQQSDQHNSTQVPENHYHHQKTFDYSLQYYDFGQTFQQQQQQQPISDHHQHSSTAEEQQLQPLMNSSSLSYMHQQQQLNSSTTMNLVHSYNEQVPIECTNGAVYSSSNTSYHHHHHQEDIKEVVHHHHHHLQHQHQ